MSDLLNMELRLTMGVRKDCACLPYFRQRGQVIVAEVTKEANRRNIDDLDLFAAYARSVHNRHQSGLPLGVAGETVDGAA